MKKNPNFDFQNSHWRIHSQLLNFEILSQSFLNFKKLSQLFEFQNSHWRIHSQLLNFEIHTQLFEF